MSHAMDLDTFLRTDPREVACGEVMELLDVYAELHAADPAAASARYPHIAAHMALCGPCAVDFQGLLALLADEPGPAPGSDR
ncbi:hypothetical protein AB0J83_36645 [Actinoplanes sp. NPDC049596]|uniref:hypothetical protein n=1 Tax=unclassified Actinoplanes TaxID=2626549 RepID=UPI003441C6D3